jgi:hypothetical protein
MLMIPWDEVTVIVGGVSLETLMNSVNVRRLTASDCGPFCSQAMTTDGDVPAEVRESICDHVPSNAPIVSCDDDCVQATASDC